MSRAIQLAAEPIEERGLPLAGRIAAGVLHEAIEQNERVDFHEMFDPETKNLFVLQVKGDSMIEDQIADGDYVVVQKQRTAPEGPDRRRAHRRGRSHAETLVSREEPHPSGAGQLGDEAHLRQRRPRAGDRRGRGAEGGVKANVLRVVYETTTARIPRMSTDSPSDRDKQLLCLRRRV